MTAELSARKDGEARHPWDWYVEEHWVTQALLDMIDLETDVDYYDPFCGGGNIPATLIGNGLRAFGTDKFQRTDALFFMGEGGDQGEQRHVMEALKRLSIVSNPPFSYQDGRLVRGLALSIVKRAYAMATHKLCILVPLKWLSSKERYRFYTETKPSIYVFSERPSMPPGNIVDQLGGKAFKRGKVDYMWLVWDKQHPNLHHSPTFWIPPRPKVDLQMPAAIPINYSNSEPEQRRSAA